MDGDQLARRRVKDDPPTDGGRADDDDAAVRRKGRRLCALSNVLAPDDQVRHRVPQVNCLVVAGGQKLVLRGMRRQGAYLFGVTL